MSSEPNVALMALNDTKAGMSGLDTAKINAIIEEASKGSNFYKAKAKGQERINRQVKKMEEAMTRLSEGEILSATLEMDKQATKLRKERDLSRTIVHIDMDAFYAAVEMRDDPSLREKPMAVGDMGMLSTSNYLARKFGVRAGMPGFIGKKLCPQLFLVPTNFDKYRAVSEVVRGVFREYDPNFCPMSLDEAYLDITDYLTRFPHMDPESTTNEIRAKIEERTNLTASAGIACNTLLAKICSDQNKPNGQFYLKPEEEDILNFIQSLPIRKVNGIGNVTEQLLNALNIKNCKDLFEKRGLIKLLFSDISSSSFLRISLGIGSTTLMDWTERERKSMSTESTFSATSNATELMDLCKRLSQDLSNDLKSKGLSGRSVTLKIKTHKFEVKTKVKNLLEFTNNAGVIASTATSILRHLMETADEKPLKLRLLGVRLSDFHDDPQAESARGRAKQSTIDMFLRGGNSSLKNESLSSYPCPICGQEVEAVNENAFNTHLDHCLMQQNEDHGASCSHNDDIARKVGFKRNSPTFESEGGGKNVMESSGPLPKKARDHEDVKGEIQGGSKLAVGPCQGSSSHLQSRCPICNKVLETNDLELINKHIDKCLEPSPSLALLSPSERSKQKSNDIKNYFTVLTK